MLTAELTELRQMIQLSLDLVILLLIAIFLRRSRRLRLFSNLVQIARLSKDLVPLVRKPGSSHAPRQLVLSVSYFELLQNRLSQFLRLNLLYVAVLELLLELFHHTEVFPVILSDFHETE